MTAGDRGRPRGKRARGPVAAKRSRLLDTTGFNQLARGEHGYLAYNLNDRYVGTSIDRYGEYARLELDLLRQLCGPGDVVIEAGANIGAHTVELARHVGTRGRVLAFEPQRLVFQLLCANVALNSLLNVDCYQAALGARTGRVTVPEIDPRRPGNFGGLSLSGRTRGSEVECMRLDRFRGLPAVKLVKIDVEGMESEVIEGGRQLIRKFRPLLYVENDRVDRSVALMELIAGLGYRLYWHVPPLFNPENLYGERENLWPTVASINLLCVHRDTRVDVRGLHEIEDFSQHPLKGRKARQ